LGEVPPSRPHDRPCLRLMPPPRRFKGALPSSVPGYFSRCRMKRGFSNSDLFPVIPRLHLSVTLASSILGFLKKPEICSATFFRRYTTCAMWSQPIKQGVFEILSNNVKDIYYRLHFFCFSLSPPYLNPHSPPSFLRPLRILW